MKFNMSVGINIKLNDVKKLYSQNLSCIKKISSPYVILLYPMYMKDVRKGVKVELDSLLKTYCKQLNGIVLGYDNVKITFPGWCFDTNPYIHHDIVADFYVFTPEVENILKGKVVKKSPNHVGCLVHNIFNVSSSIPIGMTKDKWCGSLVKEGDDLEVQITELDLRCAVPFIKGDIIPESISRELSSYSEINIKQEKIDDEDSGISCMEKQNDEEVKNDCKKKKKKKKNLTPENEDSHDISNVKQENLEIETHSKKKKKRKFSAVESEEDESAVKEKRKKKKRKLDRSKNEEE